MLTGVLMYEGLDAGIAVGGEEVLHHLAVTRVHAEVAFYAARQLEDEGAVEAEVVEHLVGLIGVPEEEVLPVALVVAEVEAAVGLADEAQAAAVCGAREARVVAGLQVLSLLVRAHASELRVVVGAEAASPAGVGAEADLDGH